LSNDFDTEGYGSVEIDFTTDLEVIRENIYKAWEQAEEDQKDNQTVAMYAVRNSEGHWLKHILSV
jgi:hypothetical protein